MKNYLRFRNVELSTRNARVNFPLQLLRAGAREMNRSKFMRATEATLFLSLSLSRFSPSFSSHPFRPILILVRRTPARTANIGD